MKIPLRLLLMATVLTSCCSTFVEAQTATVISANLAAGDVGEYATVEGVVAKVFTSKSGNTFLNIGATYPNQTFTGWVRPASPVSKSPLLSGVRRKGRENHWPNRDVQRQTGNPDQCRLSTRNRVIEFAPGFLTLSMRDRRDKQCAGIFSANARFPLLSGVSRLFAPLPQRPVPVRSTP